MEKKFSSLITDESFERLELALNEPNIFRALAVQRRELRHSNFIGYLFDPMENHGLRDLILRKFLRDIFKNSKNNIRTIFDADTLDYNEVEVRREWRNIDILIRLKEDVIVIENKVDTVNHSEQLHRYNKIAHEAFPDKKIHFVYLTPFGDTPEDDESSSHYINYSYDELISAIQSILNLYKSSINEKIFHYLEDYVSVIKRDLLMNDTLNDIARKIYHSHREALDFIFENVPDPVDELYPIFEEEIIKLGYIVCSRNKGYIRFLPKELDPLIPRVGSGWKNKELFLFEIKYAEKKATFQAAVSPSEKDNQDLVHNPLKSSTYYIKPAGNKWLVLAKAKLEFIAENELKNSNNEEIRDKVIKVLEKITPIVEEFSALLIANKELVNYSNPLSK